MTTTRKEAARKALVELAEYQAKALLDADTELKAALDNPENYILENLRNQLWTEGPLSQSQIDLAKSLHQKGRQV